jgi:hypothetical protein
MPTFFIILIFTYLGGNAYIFYRGLQTLSGFPYGIKILLTILFWLAALSFFGTMLSRNVKIPFYLSHTMYEVGTGWLIFTLYMVLFLLFFDLLKLCSISFNQSFMTSLLATFVLLGYGYYNYRHPKINTVNITLTKPLTDNRRPIKIVAVTLGKEGVLICNRKDHQKVSGFSSQVVDTTGAGDSFWGGFMSQFVKSKLNPEDCSMEELKKFARYGNAVASLCIEKKGGILSIPEEKETFKRLQISV